MRIIRPILATTVLACVALPVAAEDRAVSAAQAASAPMPGDCPRALKKHDHGAERGMPTARSAAAPCAPMAATSAAASAAANRMPPHHDHGKFHKNQ